MKSYDLTQYKVIAAQDIDDAARQGASELIVCDRVIITPSARELIEGRNFTLTTQCQKNGAGPEPEPAPAATPAVSKWDALFHSPEAEAIKAEIVEVGRKLWMRQYVDGNGGNISYRLNAETAICTPTLVSKADLKPEDLCLVDLDGNQLAGGRPRTSEILLHLEIYKSVPEAKAVVHCHPPHATAYAITGRVPPTCVIPEYEVFIGKVALSPYETPGTHRFAETVLPFVKSHNTVLLANHGIVCWADTVTHAEWYAEVVDTYCWTLMLAHQLDTPISHIPSEKASDLLNIKQKLGLPDSRIGAKECDMCTLPERPGAITSAPPLPDNPASSAVVTDAAAPTSDDIQFLINSVTDAVLAKLRERGL